MTKKIRITFILTTFISFIVSIVLTFQILGSLFYYQWDKNAAAEIYHASSYSPYTKLEPWEEVEANIGEDYEDSNWALRLVSGNMDTDVSMVICTSTVALLVYSIFGLCYFKVLWVKGSKKGRRA